MPGNHDEEEKEHKRRINKLKAKTSKMRLAVMDGYGKKSPYPLPRYFEKDYEEPTADLSTILSPSGEVQEKSEDDWLNDMVDDI